MESRIGAVAYDRQITADWHLTMPLAGGIRRDIVEIAWRFALAVKASRNPCVKGRSGPISGHPCVVRVVACVSSRSNWQSGDVMSLTSYAEESRINPLDVVERLATGNDWSFERASDDEITILVTGAGPTISFLILGWEISKRCISHVPLTCGCPNDDAQKCRR